MWTAVNDALRLLYLKLDYHRGQQQLVQRFFEGCDYRKMCAYYVKYDNCMLTDALHNWVQRFSLVCAYFV